MATPTKKASGKWTIELLEKNHTVYGAFLEGVLVTRSTDPEIIEKFVARQGGSAKAPEAPDEE